MVSVSNREKRVALIGLGPHARRIYYPYLESHAVPGSGTKLMLVVDLELNRDKVEAYINTKTVKPEEILYLNDPSAILGVLTHQEVLASLFVKHKITHVIIATEPKSHKTYLEFCIKRNMKILVDKPVTTPIELMPSAQFHKDETTIDSAAKKITEDVSSLNDLLKLHPKSRVIVQTQRRYHDGYRFVLDSLKEIINTYKIPVTYVNIYHSDGMWNMPEEFATRENHPYRYGYGKLMHSGYHFVDLLQSILRLNEQLPNKSPDSFTVFNQMLNPADHQVSINPDDYERLFGPGHFDLPTNTHGADDYVTYGELDSYSQWQFTKEGRAVTTAQMSLMQSGPSLRAWSTLPDDTYKANGRVRHEAVNVQVGPLYNIQVHSYQAVEVGDDDSQYSGVGSKNHFDIYIFRNSKLIGGKSLEVVKYGKFDSEQHSGDGMHYIGQNEQPRFRAIEELLSNTPSWSSLEDHAVTNKLMTVLYSNQAKQNFGKVPFAEYKYKEIFNE